MSNYTVFDPSTGKILRSGTCQSRDVVLQANHGETVIQGEADDIKQKVVDGKIANKTQAEIDADKPPEVKPEDMPANITNKQWQDMQDRITQLENN